MKFYERKDMEAFKKYENHIWESCNRLLNINAENHMIMCTLASDFSLDFLIVSSVVALGSRQMSNTTNSFRATPHLSANWISFFSAFQKILSKSSSFNTKH